MFCSHCGSENSEGITVCSNCQRPIGHVDSDAATESVTDSSMMNTGMAVIVGIVCLIYLVNPTAGVLEFIPDNLPFVGNLDEAAATTGLLLALSKLGLNLFAKKK